MMKFSSFLSFSLAIFFLSNILAITPICQSDKDCPNSDYFCQKTTCDASHGKCFYANDLMCTMEIRPVCGCNGKIYNNFCAATGARQNLAPMETCTSTTPSPSKTIGAPSTPKSSLTQCYNDHQCNLGEFCSKSSCGQAVVGVCAKRHRNGICTMEYNPVCGCNRKTYSNACAAFNAGVNIAVHGECPSFAVEELHTMQVCTTTSECGDNNYCNKPTCDSQQGVCTPIGGVMCPEIYLPVCGCDAKTYSSVCHARNAGINVKSTGECPLSFAPAEKIEEEEGEEDEDEETPIVKNKKPCQQSSDCKSNEFCNKESCKSASGLCVVKGDEVCFDIYQPVCGCDGKTYSSPCHAYNAGVNLEDIGQCKKDKENENRRLSHEADRIKHMFDVIKNKQHEIEEKIKAAVDRTCAFNVDCEDHEYCRKETCFHPVGVCTRHVGFRCSELYHPVCGCNQKTYATSCHAMMAGINIAHTGECSKAPRNATCEGPRHCLSSEFCKKDSCSSATGSCWNKEHFICDSDVSKPVCGCDGLTYNSSCHAHKASVNVAHQGTCGVKHVEICNENSDCGNGRWCHKKASCSGHGECLEIVQSMCAEVFEPVCGCNGVSYSNSCKAGNAQVSIKHKGQCPKKVQ